jgi:hypothetical protein
MKLCLGTSTHFFNINENNQEAEIAAIFTKNVRRSWTQIRRTPYFHILSVITSQLQYFFITLQMSIQALCTCNFVSRV